ncbi:hypothetical protein Bca4012_093231 [Brassica carinata]
MGEAVKLGVLSWRLEADHYETDEELKKIRESRVVKDDTFRKHLRGCEFWFDFRTDVLEEGFQIERYCELVWTILNEKKQVAEILELDKDVASSGSVDIGGSSDSETAANDAITVEKMEILLVAMCSLWQARLMKLRNILVHLWLHSKCLILYNKPPRANLHLL